MSCEAPARQHRACQFGWGRLRRLTFPGHLFCCGGCTMRSTRTPCRPQLKALEGSDAPSAATTLIVTPPTSGPHAPGPHVLSVAVQGCENGIGPHACTAANEVVA